MQTDTWGLVLGPKDMELLSSLLKVPCALGLGGPLSSLPEGQAQPLIQNSISALEDQGIISVGPDGGLDLDAAVAALIQAIGSAPRVFVACQGSADARLHTRYIYVQPDLLVEQELEASERITLTAVRDSAVLLRRLRDFFALSECVAAPESRTERFAISQADFVEASILALTGEVDACRSLLCAAGMEPPVADTLTSVLAESQGLGSLSTLQREAAGFESVRHLAWLTGTRGMWLVEQIAEAEAVRMRPCALAEIDDRVSEAVLGTR